MVTIEYNGTTIYVPQSWNDVTLGTYEKVYNKKPETSRERVAVIAEICNVDAALLLSWPAEIFNTIVEYIMFLYGDNPAEPSPICEINGVKYIVPIDEELSLGAWVDADEAQKADANTISTVLAIVCRPAGEEYDYKWNEERQQMFAALPVSKVLGVMAFFLHCKHVSEQRTQVFGNLRRVADLLPRNTEILRNLGASTRLLRIWQIMKFCFLTALLRYQLRKFSPTYSTVKTRNTRKTPNVN